MRIVSLLPSTTEIVAALGKQDNLVGRSHECDFPEGVTSLPSCTEPKFNPDGSSYEIDERVKALLQEGLSVYRVDEEKLAALNPDLIITQDHCEVCAASVDEVKRAVQARLGDHVEVVSVSPTDLSSVVESIRTIAEAINAEETAKTLTESMKSRLQKIQQKTAELSRPNVLAIEWMDPLMSAGNWIPELIQLAGGNPLGIAAGEHSPYQEWGTVQKYNPDIITVMPCGYSIQQTLSEISDLTSRQGWNNLGAVKNNQIYILDGNQYFNRPGPRLVDSTQILAEITHPSIFRKGKTHHGWLNLWRHQFQKNIRSHA
jgi:iron complex transport system substrate-binding protein